MWFSEHLWLFGLSVFAAAFALILVSLVQARLLRSQPSQLTEDPGQAIFLFDGEALLDASAGARLVLAGRKGPDSDFSRFLAWAEPRFEGLREGLLNLRSTGALRAEADGLSLLAEWRSGLLRITVQDPHLDAPFRGMDALSERSREEELEGLRHLLQEAPLPIWTEDKSGTIIWANQAYVDLALPAGEADQTLPVPRIFPIAEEGRRSQLSTGAGQLWYDRHVVQHGRQRSHYAVPAQAAVQAERALAAFMQTLTRTFSYLPIGLAMFDRQRRLHLFNPALTDLTALPAAFLSARPSLNSFLDGMRERGTIPEPSDYQLWRARIAALEARDLPLDFEEVWSLPSGLTYRIAVRPHPEGTLVLLLQDISDEIAMTRRMKLELELGQSVIDTSSEALAIFAASGQLLMTSAAYATLWGDRTGQGLRPLSIRDLLPRWIAAASPTPFWAELEAFVMHARPRIGNAGEIRLNDGRALTARLVALAGGASLVGFSLLEAHPGSMQPLADDHEASSLRAGLGAPTSARRG